MRRLLTVATVVVTIEAAAAIAVAVLDLASLDESRLGLGVGVAIFLVVYGGAQWIAALLLRQGRWGARGPVVASQFIQLGIAWNLRGVNDEALVVPHLSLWVAGAALLVLGCVLAAPVTRAIVDAEAAEAETSENG